MGTKEDFLQIYENSHYSLRQASKIFGVSKSTIQRIINTPNAKIYKHTENQIKIAIFQKIKNGNKLK